MIEHEGADPGGICPKSHDNEVEHQSHVLAVIVGDARFRANQTLRQSGVVSGPFSLLVSECNSPFDATEGLEVFI